MDKINNVAANLVWTFLADVKKKYIYDPHKKNRPPGGYKETPKGWTLKNKINKSKDNQKTKLKKRNDVYLREKIVKSLFTKQENSLGKTLNRVSGMDDYYVKAEKTQKLMESKLNRGNEKNWLGDNAKVVSNFDDLAGEGAVLIIAPIKNKERAKQKVDTDYNGDWNCLTDGVRCSVAVEKFKDLPGVIEGLRKTGVKIVSKPKNRFDERLKSGYSDILLNVDFGDGFVGEIQIHIKLMLQIKKFKGHQLYVKERDLLSKCNYNIKKLTLEEIEDMKKIVSKQKRLYNSTFDIIKVASNQDKLYKYMLSDNKYSYYLYGDMDNVAFVYKNNLPRLWNGEKWVTLKSFLKFADNAVEINQREFVRHAEKQGVVFD